MYIVSPCLHLLRVRAMLLSVHFDILRRFFSIKVTKIEVHCVAFVVVVALVIDTSLSPLSSTDIAAIE